MFNLLVQKLPAVPARTAVHWHFLHEEQTCDSRSKQRCEKASTTNNQEKVSSLEMSLLNSNEVLVSYQNDMVYRVDSKGKEIVQFFAASLNCETFLKRASYFGTREEYVVFGGDDGNVNVFDSADGNVVNIRNGDRFDMSRAEFPGEVLVKEEEATMVVNGVVGGF